MQTKRNSVCIENPELRMEVLLEESVDAVAMQLLKISKEQEWEMTRVWAAKYVRANRQEFWLLWSIEQVGQDDDQSKQPVLYHINYWKIYRK